MHQLFHCNRLKHKYFSFRLIAHSNLKCIWNSCTHGLSLRSGGSRRDVTHWFANWRFWKLKVGDLVIAISAFWDQKMGVTLFWTSLDPEHTIRRLRTHLKLVCVMSKAKLSKCLSLVAFGGVIYKRHSSVVPCTLVWYRKCVLATFSHRFAETRDNLSWVKVFILFSTDIFLAHTHTSWSGWSWPDWWWRIIQTPWYFIVLYSRGKSADWTALTLKLQLNCLSFLFFPTQTTNPPLICSQSHTSLSLSVFIFPDSFLMFCQVSVTFTVVCTPTVYHQRAFRGHSQCVYIRHVHR